MIEKEEILIKESRSGEAGSFGKLYDIYQPQIYRFIFLKVSRKEEAEDLTHQVFLSAWQNIKKYQIRKFPFSSWLYRIAKNKVIDFYRTSKNNISIELVNESEFKNLPSPEMKTENSLEIKKVKKAMSFMNQEQQDVIIMRFVEDMPTKEVANILGKSEGAIKLIQHRALNKLKKILEENNGENNQTA